MTDYDNTNRGIIFFKSDKPSDKHPDFSGSLNVDGVEYWVSGWNKETRAGEGISLTVKKKELQDGQSGYQKAKAVADGIKAKKDVVPTDVPDDIDLSEIPF